MKTMMIMITLTVAATVSMPVRAEFKVTEQDQKDYIACSTVTSVVRNPVEDYAESLGYQIRENAIKEKAPFFINACMRGVQEGRKGHSPSYAKMSETFTTNTATKMNVYKVRDTAFLVGQLFAYSAGYGSITGAAPANGIELDPNTGVPVTSVAVAAPAAPVAQPKGPMTCDAVVYDNRGDEVKKLQHHKGEAKVTFHSDTSATVVVPFKSGYDYDGQPHSFETMALNRAIQWDDDKASISGEGNSFAFTPAGQNWDIVLENCH